jgi:CheY-like chemotaxis protein
LAPAEADAVSRHSKAQPADEQPVDVRLDGATVLIVDDQRDSRDLLSVIFDRCGAEVLQCGSATAALEALRSRRVHLLVADLAMPEVDGFELIARVRASGRQLPAIAVSAFARPQDRLKAFEAGYAGYCAKPLEATELLRASRRVLAQSAFPARP